MGRAPFTVANSGFAVTDPAGAARVAAASGTVLGENR